MTDDKNKPVVLGPGRLYFTGGLLKPRDMGEVIPALEPRGEEIRLLQPREPTFRVEIKVTDRVSGYMRDLMRQTERAFIAAYFGPRIADLLTSDDPRQRKRGRRLRDKKFRFRHRFTVAEAEAFRDAFRDRHPDLKSFWNTQLGEPYDPERYRKD